VFKGKGISSPTGIRGEEIIGLGYHRILAVILFDQAIYIFLRI
jgi:hypothetical protein